MSVTPYYHPEAAKDVTLYYADHLKRAEDAHRLGWYLESLMIVYSIMENYTYRLLLLINIPFKAKDRMFQCMEYLKQHMADRDLPEAVEMSLLKEFSDNDLLDRISDWRIKRNLMIHDYAIRVFTKEEMTEISMEGIRLVRLYAAAVDNAVRGME